MNIPVVTTRKEDIPPCFGLEWDKNAPECAGGPDASYTHPKTGAHVHDRCDFYQSCGARTAAVKNAQGNLIPPQQLLRPAIITAPPNSNAPAPAAPAAAPTAVSPPQTFGQWLQQEQQKYATAAGISPPRPAVQATYVQQPQVMPNAPVQPATTWQLNYSMPSYLSAPEMRQPGETIWAVLFREVLRSMFKALGHSVAHFFDNRPLRDKPPTP